ncbi:hypothetical protein Cni_G21206 [Canna indica]|uniref:Homeobox domain-containing protein n=1 Tax=Canna indica TaxID=4628 RepID=A0AAQ3KQC0_9LILI|nr:hypothetical protein Cni_G21206 [Canna indica]
MDHENGNQGKKPIVPDYPPTKIRKSRWQVEILEEAYQAHPRPSRPVKLDLAAKTGLEYPQIQYWFGNRRSLDRNGPRKYRSKKNDDTLNGEKSTQVTSEVNSEIASETPSVNVARATPSHMSKPLPLLMTGSTVRPMESCNVLNPRPLQVKLPTGASIMHPKMAQTLSLPSPIILQHHTFQMQQTVQQLVTHDEDKLKLTLRADTLITDTKIEKLEMKAPMQAMEVEDGQKIHQSAGSSGLTGFQQVGRAIIPSEAASWNSNNNHHKWIMQNKRKIHPLSWHHHGHGFDPSNIVMPGERKFCYAGESSRVIFTKWNWNERKAVHIMDNNEKTLSLSTHETDTNLGDEYDENTRLSLSSENVKSSAAGKSVTVVEGKAKGKAVEVLNNNDDEATEDLNLYTERNFTLMTDVDDDN